MPTPARPSSSIRLPATTASTSKSNPGMGIKSHSTWSSRLFRRRRQSNQSWSIDFNSSFPYSLDSTTAVSASTTIYNSSISTVDQVSDDAADATVMVAVEFSPRSPPVLFLPASRSSPFHRLLQQPDINDASSLHSHSSADDHHHSHPQTCRDFL